MQELESPKLDFPYIWEYVASGISYPGTTLLIIVYVPWQDVCELSLMIPDIRLELILGNTESQTWKILYFGWRWGNQ